MELYQVIMENENVTSFSDKMVDATCNSLSSVWEQADAGLCTQKMDLLGSQSKQQNASLLVKFCWWTCIFYIGACFCHVKGNLSHRKQQTAPHLVKNLQDVSWYCCGPRLSSKFQESSTSNLTVSELVSSWSRPVYHWSSLCAHCAKLYHFKCVFAVRLFW